MKVHNTKRNEIYDFASKKGYRLSSGSFERYETSGGDYDVPTYHFFKVVTKTLCSWDITEEIMEYLKLGLDLPNFSIEISDEEFENILNEYKKGESKTEEYTGSSAADDIGSSRSQEIDADNY